MLKKSIRILNFDNSIIKQTGLISRYKTEVIDLTDIAPAARIWINRKDENKIKRRLKGSSKNAVTFLGSGDFHHITSSLIDELDEPVSVVSFDLHPDWRAFLPPRLSCGSWVKESLKNKNVLKCILIGAASADISGIYRKRGGIYHFYSSLQSADLLSLKNNRVEIYPYLHSPSTVFLRKVPENVSIKLKHGLVFTRISWNKLKGRDLGEFFLGVIRRLPAKRVYVTIDKDCLKREYAMTNWETGKLSLDELLLMLSLIKENLDIAGLDITGDYSDVRSRGAIKRLVSFFDHPRAFSAKGRSESRITAVNEATNLKILETLL